MIFIEIAAVLDTLLLAFCVCNLFGAVYPRDYERISSSKKWQEWRTKYAAQLAEECDTGQLEMSHQFRANLIPALTDAQLKNVSINEARRNYYYRAVRWSIPAAAVTLLMALFRLGLYLEE